MAKFTGSCLCGSVSFKADGEPMFTGNCHCEDCRKATGASYATIVFMGQSDVEMSGDLSTFDHTADSGTVLTKSFCGKCGGTVATQNSARAGMIGLMAGVINEHDIVKPGMNVYAGNKLACTPLDEKIPAFDKMPG
ncbi:MAG: GFA family protein [Maricaulaceae bacterium]